MNSSKGKTPPSEEMIVKLEQRNVKLFNILSSEGVDDVNVQELKMSIDQGWVRKFWNQFR